MLEFLKLHNFQPYADYLLEFDPFVTTVVGPTDAGKSSLLRALKWVVLNTPQGDDFIRYGSKECIATIAVDDRVICRGRGKQNFYTLDGEVFQSFGVSVPAPVAALVNVGGVNFQDQITLPFWFCLPPAQVGRELNEIVNLEIIDLVTQAVAASCRKVQGEVEYTRGRLEQARRERDELGWVKEADAELRVLEQLYTDYAQVGKTVAQIESVLADEGRVSLRLETVLNAKADALELMSLAEEYTTLHDDVVKLENLITSYTELQQQCQNNATSRVESEKQLAQLLKDRCPLCQQPTQSSPS